METITKDLPDISQLSPKEIVEFIAAAQLQLTGAKQERKKQKKEKLKSVETPRYDKFQVITIWKTSSIGKTSITEPIIVAIGEEIPPEELVTNIINKALNKLCLRTDENYKGELIDIDMTSLVYIIFVSTQPASNIKIINSSEFRSRFEHPHTIKAKLKTEMFIDL